MNNKLSLHTIIQYIVQLVNYIYRITSSLFTTNRIDGREQTTEGHQDAEYQGIWISEKDIGKSKFNLVFWYSDKHYLITPVRDGQAHWYNDNLML